MCLTLVWDPTYMSMYPQSLYYAIALGGDSIIYGNFQKLGQQEQR
jgi:hypothetical protein